MPELEHVLRLVAEGKITPEEADPIVDALTRAQEPEIEADAELHGREARGAMREQRRAERIHRRVDRAFAHAEQRIAHARAAAGAAAGGRHLRIRVTERGRQVVNLHIPIGLVEGALQFVPGLAGDQRDRIREAVRAGVTGPIVDVEDPDGGGGVLISVE